MKKYVKYVFFNYETEKGVADEHRSKIWYNFRSRLTKNEGMA